jgi:hypothetical protein
MKRSSVWLLWVATCGSNLPGCQPPPPPPPQQVQIEALGERGAAVAEVEVVVGGRVVARTDERGLASLHLNGADGARHQAGIRCPEARYTSPAQPLLLQKATLSDPSQVPVYRVQCVPRTQKLVVALRIKEGGGLPVMYLGSEVVRLDESGAGHIAFEVTRGDKLELMLDTAAFPALLPRSPTLPVQAGDGDDLVVLDFSFSAKKKPKPKRASVLRPTQI